MQARMIGTWRMAHEGVILGYQLLQAGSSPRQAIERAIMDVEDNPQYRSVGYGGLPNRDGVVELDAAFMDGDNLRFGAVMSTRNIKNPILAAGLLSERRQNILLAGGGAEEFAVLNGLTFQNMLSPKAKEYWLKQRKGDAESHDTVCVIALSDTGSMAVGTSTSGLDLKEPGRVGDTPLVGSGLYGDSMYGCAAATGSGEDIMKGCLSFEIVRLLKQGLTPQEACEKALFEHRDQMQKRGCPAESMHVLAMDKQGLFGAATTRNTAPFPYIIATEAGVEICLCQYDGRIVTNEKASRQWLDDPANAAH